MRNTFPTREAIQCLERLTDFDAAPEEVANCETEAIISKDKEAGKSLTSSVNLSIVERKNSD
jgi:hypothetical protein